MSVERAGIRRRVVVVGSVNIDEVVGVAALPAPGETVLGWERATGLGGKGANQAVAAAVAGGDVALFAAVGDDARGVFARERLGEYGVDTGMMVTLGSVATGRALVLLSEDGANEIIVVGGANQALDVGALSGGAAGDVVGGASGGVVGGVSGGVSGGAAGGASGGASGGVMQDALREALRDAAVMVLQGEVTPAVNRAALRLAAESGVRAVVNLAPVQDLGGDLALADPLVVNEIEAGQLVGVELASVRDVVDAASVSLLRGLARSVVVTLGEAGAVLVAGDEVHHVAAPRAECVRDSTGAGDALVGVLAAALAQGLGFRAAVERAVRAASLSVTEVGAADSYEAFRGRLG